MIESTEALYSKFLRCTGVSTDTRTIQKGNIFFALSGPNFNGNQYAQAAIDKGALVAVIDDDSFLGKGCVLVEDTLKALQDLAGEHRNRFKGKVLGITGSNGKTTTKELCREVLSKKYNVQATVGNLNNHIGVPLTILKWTDETEIAIVEMGANHVGEIAGYCAYARPTHGIITNIGHAHTEGFGGIEGVLRGKSELFDSLRNSGGVPFINSLDERLNHMTKRFSNGISFPANYVTLGDSKEYLSIQSDFGLIETQLTGAYNFPNASVAIEVGRHFGVEKSSIKAALENYQPENQRSQIIRKGEHTLIADCYNANPDSMRAALSNLARFDGNRVAVIGDMNELSNSDEEHRSIGEFVRNLNFEKVILVGKKIVPALESLANAEHYSSTEDLLSSDINLPESSTVLLKASRSIKLERLLEKF